MPWAVTRNPSRYAAFFAALGYERRARYVAEALAPIANSKFAMAFPDRKVHHYTQNKNWFTEAGYELCEIDDDSFPLWFEKILRETKPAKLHVHALCVDISSLSRYRLAVIIDALRKFEGRELIQVDFIYSLAEYSPPSEEILPNTHVGPVLPSFAGWTTEPDRAPVAIVGLGYEQGKALGAVEHVQASEVWSFEPVSPITKYSAALQSSNKTLLETIHSSHRLIYPVGQPLDCFVRLESLTNRISHSNNPVLFPFGPKIFTLCSLLVACLNPSAAVWRVSSENSGMAIDREPSKFMYGLRVEFLPKAEHGAH